MFVNGGSTTYTQTFGSNAGVEHFGWDITVSKWESRNIETKVVSFIIKTSSKDSILDFNMHIEKISAGIIFIFLIEL